MLYVLLSFNSSPKSMLQLWFLELNPQHPGCAPGIQPVVVIFKSVPQLLHTPTSSVLSVVPPITEVNLNCTSNNQLQLPCVKHRHKSGVNHLKNPSQCLHSCICTKTVSNLMYLSLQYVTEVLLGLGFTSWVKLWLCLPRRSLWPVPLSAAPPLSLPSTWPFALYNPSCSSQSPGGGSRLTLAPARSPGNTQINDFYASSGLSCTCVHTHLAKDLLIDSEGEIQNVGDVIVFHPLKRLVELLIQILQIRQVCRAGQHTD